VTSAPEQSIEVCNAVSLCTLDIIMRCALSYSSDVQNEGSVSTSIHCIATKALICPIVHGVLLFAYSDHFMFASKPK